MPKASPARVSFNGGIFSPLLYGRVDHDRYQSGMRTLHNFVAAAQGPAIARSGTEVQRKAISDTNVSALVPFVFSSSQSMMLEFSNLLMRVHTDTGVVTHGDEVVQRVISQTPFIIRSPDLLTNLTAAGFPLAVNDYVTLKGFPDEQVNNVMLKVTAINGGTNDITFDYNGYTGPIALVIGATAAKIFQLVTPYSSAHVRDIRFVQDIDVLYLFCRMGTSGAGYKPQKLSRFGATDWTLEDVAFSDGPYLQEPLISENPTKLTPSATGEATALHTAAVTGGNTASAITENAGNEAWRAFDRDISTWWEPTTDQGDTGAGNWIKYQFAAARVIKGYIIYNMPAINSTDSNVTPVDRRPRCWTLQGSNNNVDWIVLDEQRDYSLWTNNRTQYIRIRNNVAYTYYRLNVTALESGGNFKMRIQQVVLADDTPPNITLTAASKNAINKKKGFLASDVGRFIRLYQGDGFWHPVKIVGFTDAFNVTVQTLDEPLYSTLPVTRWRMGAFSSSIGYPTNVTFAYDRLFMGGVRDYPINIYGSKDQGEYETMSPSEPDGTVVDSNGIVAVPRTRDASALAWMMYTGRGLALGYGTGEAIYGAASENTAFSARNQKYSPATKRGSAFVAPVQVDNEILYVTRDKKTLREFAYVFQSDGYKSPSMQIFATNVSTAGFAQIVYQQHPHSIVWARMLDGTIAGFTYNREEGVLGWHTHALGVNFQNETVEVEYIATKPSDDGTTDDLWLMTKRTFNGVTQRFIEKMKPFWDFGNTVIGNAWYVDFAKGGHFNVATNVITGLSHLEGRRVVGIADGVAFGYGDITYTVVNGTITLPDACSDIVVGLHFDAVGETTDMIAGAADGTSKGKTGRINNMAVEVWDTHPDCEIGVYHDDEGKVLYTPISFNEELAQPPLLTTILGPDLPEQLYGKRRSLAFRRTRPYPMNVVGLYPQMNVQDR